MLRHPVVYQQTSLEGRQRQGGRGKVGRGEMKGKGRVMEYRTKEGKGRQEANGNVVQRA